jgi:predicted small metal-binding protein
MKLITPKLRQTSADDRHFSGTKKAWDCGCQWHLNAGSEQALVAKIIYHLAVQHPEAHHTLEQADELVAAQAYDEPS